MLTQGGRGTIQLTIHILLQKRSDDIYNINSSSNVRKVQSRKRARKDTKQLECKLKHLKGIKIQKEII